MSSRSRSNGSAAAAVGAEASRRSTARSAAGRACCSCSPDRDARVADRRRRSALAAATAAVFGAEAPELGEIARAVRRRVVDRGGGGIVGWSGSSPSRSLVSTSRGSGGSARTRRDGAISDHQQRRPTEAPTTIPTTNCTTLRMVVNGNMAVRTFRTLVIAITRPSGGMADTTDSKSVARKGVRVQIPPRAQKERPAQIRFRVTKSAASAAWLEARGPSERGDASMPCGGSLHLGGKDLCGSSRRAGGHGKRGSLQNAFTCRP